MFPRISNATYSKPFKKLAMDQLIRATTMITNDISVEVTGTVSFKGSFEHDLVGM